MWLTFYWRHYIQYSHVFRADTLPTPDLYEHKYEFELGHDDIDVTLPPDTLMRKHNVLKQDLVKQLSVA